MNVNLPCKRCGHHYNDHGYYRDTSFSIYQYGEFSCRGNGKTFFLKRHRCRCPDFVEMNNLEYLEQMVDKNG